MVIVEKTVMTTIETIIEYCAAKMVAHPKNINFYQIWSLPVPSSRYTHTPAWTQDVAIIKITVV